VPQSNSDLFEYNLRVYWMTPLGRALKDTMFEMNLDANLKKKISSEFEKAIEK